MTDPDLSKQAAQLSVQVEGLSQSVTALSRRQRRDRTLISWVIAGLCVSLAALIGVGIVAIRANTAANRADSAYAIAESNKTAQRLTCEANNQSRAAQVQLWAYLIQLSFQTSPPPTRAQALAIAQFRSYVERVLAPRDCSKPVTPTPPPTLTPTPTVTR